MNPKNDQSATGSTPSRGEAPADSPSGSGEMPRNFSGFDKSYGDKPDEETNAGGAAPDPFGDELLGGLGALPFDFMALKTGHEHWELNAKQKELMGACCRAVGKKHGVELNPSTNPEAVLAVAYLAFGIPRIVEEIRLLRQEAAERAKSAA